MLYQIYYFNTYKLAIGNEQLAKLFVLLISPNIAKCILPTANCFVQTISCQLPTAFCQLLSFYEIKN